MNTYSATPSYLPVGSMAFSSTRPDSGLMHKRELRANVSQRAFITMERKVIIAPVSGIGDPQVSVSAPRRR